MKVTKSKLQKMIKEELQNLTEECHPQDYQCQEEEAQRAKKRSDYKKGLEEQAGQEIKDIGALAQALAAHGITGPDFAAWESGELRGVSETSLTIDTDGGRATIRIEGPGGIKYGV